MLTNVIKLDKNGYEKLCKLSKTIFIGLDISGLDFACLLLAEHLSQLHLGSIKWALTKLRPDSLLLLYFLQIT